MERDWRNGWCSKSAKTFQLSSLMANDGSDGDDDDGLADKCGWMEVDRVGPGGCQSVDCVFNL